MKDKLKLVARWISLALVCPFYLILIAISPFCGSERAFQSFSHFFSLFPGTIGNYIRGAFYQFSLKNCSDSAVVSFGVIFSSRLAEVGSRTYIGPYSIIGRAKVMDDTLISSRVSLLSGLKQHGHAQLDVPIRDQEGEFRTICIGSGSWIGEGAVVGADVGEGSIVAAGSVVFSDVEQYTIVRGNPAELLSKRTNSAR